MLRVVRRINHRDEALQHLGALLLVYPAGRQFTRDFPALRGMLRAHFQAGVSPAHSALQMAALILAEVARHLLADQRDRVLDRLLRTDPRELEALASERLATRRRAVDDPPRFAAELIGVAIFIAGRMAEAGQIGRPDYGWFVDAVGSALAGADGGAGALAERFRLETRAGRRRPEVS